MPRKGLCAPSVRSRRPARQAAAFTLELLEARSLLSTATLGGLMTPAAVEISPDRGGGGGRSYSCACACVGANATTAATAKPAQIPALVFKAMVDSSAPVTASVPERQHEAYAAR